MSKFSKVSFFLSGISVVLMSMARYLIGDWVPFCWVALVLTIFFLGLGLFRDRSFFREFFSMKTTKEGMSMGVLILLLVAVLVIVNYLGVKYSKTWDFSTSQTNSLSDQSIKILKSLDADLKVLFFYKKGVEGNEENRRLSKELIKKYQDVSSKVQLEFVEVNERPDLSSEFGVDKGSGIIFLDYKGRRNRVEKIDEQEFTSALVKVSREHEKVIYFTIGHGEKGLQDAREALGLNSLRVMLENNRYQVKELALIQNPVVPKDADIVVIAGPIQNFQENELVALEEFLKSGGSLFLALEPQNTVGLEKVISKVGIQFENNYIFNVMETVLGRGVNQGPAMGAVFSNSNKITKAFGRGEVTLFRNPQSLKKVSPPEGVIVDEIVMTTPASVAYSSLKKSGEVEEKSYTLVSEVSGQWPGTPENAKPFSIVIAGDVDFITNQMLYQAMNRDLILNSLAALAKEENLISIAVREPQATTMIMTETKFALFLFAFAIPLPILLLATSIGLWLRRRNA